MKISHFSGLVVLTELDEKIIAIEKKNKRIKARHKSIIVRFVYSKSKLPGGRNELAYI